MHLVGRDGNLENVTIAFALVESEDIACYTWFVQKVTDAGINLSGLPMFCDRDQALYSVANDLQLNLKFCTQHILRNVNSKFSEFKLATHGSLIWKLQAVYTKAEYDSTLGIIEINAGRNVRDYLAAIDPERWCVHKHVGVQRLYGWRTSNFVESVFGTQLVLGLRALPPLAFFKAMCTRIMQRAYQRHCNAIQWQNEQRQITKGAMKLYEKERRQAGFYRVIKSSDDITHVCRTDTTVEVSRRCTESEKHCTCGFIDQYGIPCRHAVATLIHRGRMHDVNNLFDPCYHVDTYANAFKNAQIVVPLEDELVPDHETIPAPKGNKKGRPPTKRIRSNGEERISSDYKCSKCNQRGHNKRTCRS
ncbi:unnamed protein product [Phytophthora fragariaefolia]|uniref:Unnamed protein product n=1 Tax=Phytophthora fragariaefolia TaxID=1490495 RepID=A0A9W7CSY4_9STRA|nr:unnamed protein product [Phytophthora fragariaefolia]